MDAQSVMRDPEFHSLPNTEKAKVLREVDPDFAGLPASEQNKVILTLKPDSGGDAIANQPAALALENTGRPFYEEVIKPSDPSQPSLIGNQTPTERDYSLLKKIGKQSARATLELGGATLAGVGGALLTRNPLAIAGLGAGGFATGKGVADYLLGENNTVDVPFDENGNAQMAAPRPMTIGEMAGKTATDFGTGMAMETLGAGVPALGRGVMAGGRALYPRITNNAVNVGAGRNLDMLSRVPKGYEANAAEADALERLVPGLKFNPAQRTGAPSAARDFKAMQNYGVAQDVSELGKVQQAQALKDYLDQNIANGSVDDLYKALEGNATALDSGVAGAAVAAPIGKAPYEVGKEIVDTVTAKAAPVKTKMRELFEAVPTDYQLNTRNTQQAFREFMESDVPLSAKRELQADVQEYMKLGSNTTVGKLQAAYQHFNELANTLGKDGKDNAARLAKEIRKAIDSDFGALAENTRSGGLLEVNGKLVNVGALGEELAANKLKIAEMQSLVKNDLDYRAIEKAIIDAGGKPSTVSANWNQKAVNEANLADFKRRFGKSADIPSVAVDNTKQIDNYVARNSEIQKTLEEAGQPRDVEAALSTARKYAKEHYYDKFKRGDTLAVTKQGNEASGLAKEYEIMPKRFMNQSGAEDLQRAVGKKEAADIMRQHYQYDFAKMYENNPAGIKNWIIRNREGLKAYGLDKEFGTIANQRSIYETAVANKDAYSKSIAGKILGKEDVTATIDTILNSPTPKKNMAGLVAAVNGNKAALDGLRAGLRDNLWARMQNAGRDVSGANIASDAKAQAVMSQYRSTMEFLYSKDEMAALDTVAKAIEISKRDGVRVAGGGASTSQNLFDGAKNLWSASTGITGRIAMNIVKMVPAIGKEKVMELTARASYDPALAKQLLDATKSGKIGTFAKKFGKMAVSSKGQIATKNALQLTRDEEE